MSPITWEALKHKWYDVNCFIVRQTLMAGIVKTKVHYLFIFRILRLKFSGVMEKFGLWRVSKMVTDLLLYQWSRIWNPMCVRILLSNVPLLKPVVSLHRADMDAVRLQMQFVVKMETIAAPQVHIFWHIQISRQFQAFQKVNKCYYLKFKICIYVSCSLLFIKYLVKIQLYTMKMYINKFPLVV